MFFIKCVFCFVLCFFFPSDGRLPELSHWEHAKGHEGMHHLKQMTNVLHLSNCFKLFQMSKSGRNVWEKCVKNCCFDKKHVKNWMSKTAISVKICESWTVMFLFSKFSQNLHQFFQLLSWQWHGHMGNSRNPTLQSASCKGFAVSPSSDYISIFIILYLHYVLLDGICQNLISETNRQYGALLISPRWGQAPRARPTQSYPFLLHLQRPDAERRKSNLCPVSFWREGMIHCTPSSGTPICLSAQRTSTCLYQAIWGVKTEQTSPMFMF